MSLSIVITALVNFVTFLASIPLIGAGIWVATKTNTECVRFLAWPIIAIGVIILLVSLAGFIGACCRIPWLLWLYLFVMFFVILLLMVFIIFAFVVTKDGPTGGGGRRTFHLRDYQPWLRMEVRDNWSRIRNCIMESNACSDLNKKYTSYAAYSSADLSPVQAGCCSPPPVCNFQQYANPTFWSNPRNANADADCTVWSNAASQLCYNCDSCKGGVAAQVKQGWRTVAVLSVVVFIVLIVVYIIGCCAFRNAQTHKLFRRHADSYRSSAWRRKNWFRNY